MPLFAAIVEVSSIAHAFIILFKTCIYHRCIALELHSRSKYMWCGNYADSSSMPSSMNACLKLCKIDTWILFSLSFLTCPSCRLLGFVLMRMMLTVAFPELNFPSSIFESPLFFVLSKQQHNVLESHRHFTWMTYICLQTKDDEVVIHFLWCFGALSTYFKSSC